jgi:CBS domain-containing protein
MKVEQIMSRDVKTCAPEDTLNRAAQLMWEYDVGCIPIVSQGNVVGIVTDRDVCMAAYTQGRRLDEIPISTVMSSQVQTCTPGDTLETASAVMKRHQLRRLPVVKSNRELCGILSMADLTRGAEAEPNQRVREQYLHQVEATLAAVMRPRMGTPRLTM